jgi:tRNA G18 (ribose-2'-O)-methylase SpoU
MPILRTASLEDPLTAEYRGVRDPELLRARGLFIAEGREVVRRLIRESPYEVRSLLLNDAAWTALEDLFDQLPHEAVVYRAPANAFAEISGVHIHRGCLALGVRSPLRELGDLIREARTLVVLESVANADNVGGVFRNAAAFGADAVLLDPSSCDPLYRKAIRTSAGASLVVPFARMQPWPDAVEVLRAEGFAIVAVTPREPSIALDEWVSGRPERIALAFGSEGAGLAPAVLARADVRVRIPMSPGVDSVNVSVAAGIVLARVSSLR